MLGKVPQLFTIRSRLDAYLVIYAIAVGATRRGLAYVSEYPGWTGHVLFLACCGTVLIAGAKILDCVRLEQAVKQDGAANAPLTASKYPEGG